MIPRRKRQVLIEGGFFADIWNAISQGVPQAVTNVIGEVSHSASDQIQTQLGIKQPVTPTPTIVVTPSAQPIPVWVYAVPIGIVGLMLVKKLVKD